MDGEPRFGVVVSPLGRLQDRLGGDDDGHGVLEIDSVRLPQLVEEVSFYAAEEQVPAGRAQPLGVVREDDERSGAQRGAAAEPQHDHRQLGSGGVREARLQRSGAGEQQASVYVKERDLAAGKCRWRRCLYEAP